jgi:hypothetical protein
VALTASCELGDPADSTTWPRLVVGAWTAEYVHRLVGGAWTQEAKLLASDGAIGDGLGAGVAIDAGRIVAGARGDDIGTQSNQGSAYVFRRDAPGVWAQESKLVAASGASGDEFGRSVAIDGTTAIVGTWPFFSDGPGAAHVFVRASSMWTQQATLVHPAPASADYFGFSVDVSGDRALVGAWADDIDGTTNQGSAHLFTRADGAWSHWAELTLEKSEPSAYFGFAVGLDEGVAAVGSRLDDVGAHTNQGSVAVV